ncbi:MAG: rhodanese-like domain-containing protein [Candidatus Moranbacteria bacterium]|nr:rhodanese-like domain-containing protein [Candidatus Moranbacteria bacterium]MDD3965106.1 rhodanese-like domain-containing protein [Candidatus Moranbacteria bacterium]
MTYSRTSIHDKRALVVGSVLIVFVGAYFISRSIFQKEDITEIQSVVIDTKKTDVPTITSDVLWKKMQNGDKIHIIDIRSETAFEEAHIAHSVPLSLSALSALSVEKETILVIVLSESDFQKMETSKNILEQKSSPFFFLKGGIEAWKNFGAPVISMGDPNSLIDQSKVNYIELKTLKTLLKEDASKMVLFDVQTNENYQKKHIAGAFHIPLSELERRVEEVPFGRIIVVYGENADISYQGGVRLADLGVFTAQTLIGNTHLSSESGLTLEP